MILFIGSSCLTWYLPSNCNYTVFHKKGATILMVMSLSSLKLVFSNLSLAGSLVNLQ